MAEMDQGIKRLLQSHPADVLELALPGVEYLEPMPAEVATEPQLLMDTLFRVRYRGVECAVNVEAQAHPDPDMPRRCFEYGSRASVVFGVPVLSVVLWLERRGAIPTPPYQMLVGDWVQATWQFINIEVFDLRAPAIVATEHLGLLPLVPFMRDASIAVIESAARLVKERSAPGEASILASLLAVFGARQYGNDAMRALIRRLFMSTELLDQSPLYREWVDKAKAEGLAEGKAEGEAQGMRIAVQAALEGRFQSLDAGLLAALEVATPDALKETLRHITTDSLDQVRERLRQPAE